MVIFTDCLGYNIPIKLQTVLLDVDFNKHALQQSQVQVKFFIWKHAVRLFFLIVSNNKKKVFIFIPHLLSALSMFLTTILIS